MKEGKWSFHYLLFNSFFPVSIVSKPFKLHIPINNNKKISMHIIIFLQKLYTSRTVLIYYAHYKINKQKKNKKRIR